MRLRPSALPRDAGRRDPERSEETDECGFCRTRLRRFRPLLAFGRIPYKGLLILGCLANPDP